MVWRDAASYWDSPSGWALQGMYRKLRQVDLAVDGEPVAKGRQGNRRTPDLQRAVLAQMRSQRRRAFRGPVALDVHFTSTRANPPVIYALAKYLLDVLGPANDQRVLKRSRLLYGDDRQVKLLHVRLDQAWQPDAEAIVRAPGTWIEALRVRDAVEDLRIADRLRSIEDWQDTDTDPFAMPGHELNGPLSAGEPPARLPADQNEAWSRLQRFDQFWHQYRAQTAHLAATDAYLLAYLCACASDIAGTGRKPPSPLPPGATDGSAVALLSEMYRPLFVTPPFGLPLPGFAIKSGEWDAYREAMRQNLTGFLDRWPVFRPLLTPIKITFLVAPSIQGMDPDNIARTFLPILHQTLQPHIEPETLHQFGGPSSATPH